MAIVELGTELVEGLKQKGHYKISRNEKRVCVVDDVLVS